METRRIFYEDVYQTCCEAEIKEVRTIDGAVWVRLDQTAFYPEGGGQPSDFGVFTQPIPDSGTALNEKDEAPILARVVDVQEKDGEIWHRISEAHTPLSAGMRVRGKIDWLRRLDLMQQHSGEHIVSGLIHAKYGFDNVGFHLTTDSMTVDISGELTWDELMEIEAEANRLVRADIPLEITWPDQQELAQIPYRSKKELDGEVRIVTIPGGDICACCGTHVSRTGEIGAIKLTAVQKWKTGVRVWLDCGARAEEHHRMLLNQNRVIQTALSAKPEETAAAMERVLEEQAQLKAELTAWKYKLYDARAKQYAGNGNLILFEEALSMDDLRHLADRLIRVIDGCCLVLSGDDADGYRYVLGKRGGDVRALAKELGEALSGRGGGKPEMVQGTFFAVKSRIEEVAAPYFYAD